MRNSLLVICFLSLSSLSIDGVSDVLSAEVKDAKVLQNELTKETEVKGITAKVIWLREDLLKIAQSGNNELLEELERDSLWAFQILLNTHSPSYDFTRYAMEKNPYLVVNNKQRRIPVKWKEGESGMPSHHRNGVLFFKKLQVKTTALELVIPDLFGNNLKFLWNLQEE